MIHRRDFLRALLALPLAATFDVEKLLWMPGQFVAVRQIHLDEINAVTLKQIMPQICDDYFKADPFLKYLRERRHQECTYVPLQGGLL